MRKYITLFLVIIMLLALLISCAPSTTPEPTAVASKAVGTLVYARPDLGTEVWIPDQPTGSTAVMSSCYEFLYYKDEEGNPIPGLAERWEVSPDGLSYTFHLHKGTQFHDGWGELTADDVKYTYELGIGKGSVSSALLKWKGSLDKIEVTDRYTIVFSFKTLFPAFFTQAGREYAPQFSIVSKKYVETVGVEQAGRHPIGTGPYKFVEHVFGDYVKFEAVENHWRKTPAFKTLIIKKVPEEASRVAMIRAGEVDIIDLSIGFRDEVLKAGCKVKSSIGALGSVVALGGQFLPTVPTFDPTVPWVGDPKDPESMERALKVRKALCLGVNREEIVSTIIEGEGEPLAVLSAYPGSTMYDPALKPYPYDPEQAKRLLAEAGYPNGFEMTMKLFAQTGRPLGPIIGEAAAMMWQKIGVQVKLEPTEYPTFRPAIVARQTSGLTWVYCGLFYDVPVVGYSTMMHSTSALPGYGFESAEVDMLIEKALAEPNLARRTELERQLGRYVYDNYLVVPVGTMSAIWGISNRVGDWPLCKQGQAHATNFESITHGPGFNP